MVPLSHFSVLAFLYSIQLFVQPSLCTRQPALKRPPVHDAPYQSHYVRPTYGTASKNPNRLRNTILPRQSNNASSEDESLAQFGQVISVLGHMERTDQDFVDGLALDLFAPSNRTVVVTQNFSPLSATFVQGSSGEPFVPVSNYSYVIKTSDQTPDLIAKVELPYDPAALEAQGINPSNTYVGKLNSVGNAWMVSETQRNVHVTENKTRIIKLTSLDGEYRLLARATADTSNIFLQYGDGATRTFNITGSGGGIQEAEFVDGLRLAVRSSQPLALNAALAPGVDAAALPAGTRSLYPFRWAVNATVRFPVDLALLLLNASASSAAVPDGLLARELGAGAKRFRMVDGGAVAVELLGSEPGVVMAGLGKLDGEYVVLKAEKPLRGAGARAQQAEMASSAVVPRTRRVLVYWQLAVVALCMFLR